MGSESSYEQYLAKYPNGKYASDAWAALQRIKPAKLRDPRDGRTYETVRIGRQIWMAEDMGLMLDKTSHSNYGRLYRWADAQTLCPDGWRLPTVWDFVRLCEFLGAKFTYDQSGALPHEYVNGSAQISPMDFAPETARALKSRSDWELAGTNSSGFNAKPAGFWYAGLKNIGVTTSYWTATEGASKNSYFRFTIWKPMQVNFVENHALTRHSCRCIKE